MESNLDVRIVPINRVCPDPSQPRKTFDKEKLEELAASISKYGILSPINVRQDDFIYVIIAGERRWRAARLAGLKEVPVKIENASDIEIAEISLIENLQRDDLNPVEEAVAYKKLMDEYYLSQEDLAEKISKTRSYVSNIVRLLKLPDDILELVKDGKLSTGHARALINVSDKDYQSELARRIIDEGLSVRETEKLAKKKPGKGKSLRNAPSDEARLLAVKELAEEATDRIGTKVQIDYKKDKTGVIRIEFYSDEELERIIYGFQRKN